ncbi:hypothetical protein [Fodinibius sp. AD559]|uniref:hypothetical protein n=1 Tax=Fodinibius sp. AD559 TaxID=3424179 RepID=UPI004046CCD6
MSIDISKIDRFLDSVKEDERGFCIKNEFTQIQSVIFFDLADGKKSDYNLELINKNINYIITESWNILTVIYRIEWTKEQLEKGNINESHYTSFLTVDINYFHICLRSIFDYLAQIVRELSENSGQVSESFNKIQNWLNKKGSNKDRLGRELANFVMDCDWFKDIRGIRDAIVHQGSESLIFVNEEKILFQVINGLQNQLYVPEIMQDGKTVDFRLYAGIYISFLFDYLEDLAELIIETMDLKIKHKTARNYHYGLKVLVKWAKDAKK